MQQKAQILIREALHAGTWYVNNKEQLNCELEDNLEKANPIQP